MEKRYHLSLLVSAAEQDPEPTVTAALRKYTGDATIKVEPCDFQAVRVTIVGRSRTVDAAHQALNHALGDAFDFARVGDELGSKLRREAYPLLGQVEERLRAFINEAAIRVLGFSWWDLLGEENIRRRVADVERKNRGRGVPHHPIEYSEFEHLIELVTADLSRWRDDQPLSIGQLSELVTQATSLEELRNALEERTRARSFWDSVFVHLFKDEAQWSAAKEALTTRILPLRNKVMHHRPMFLFELEQVRESSRKVLDALDAERRVVDPAEQRELRRTARTLIDQLAEWQMPVSGIVHSLLLAQQARREASMLPPAVQLQQALEIVHAAQETRHRIDAAGGVTAYLRQRGEGRPAPPGETGVSDAESVPPNEDETSS